MMYEAVGYKPWNQQKAPFVQGEFLAEMIFVQEIHSGI